MAVGRADGGPVLRAAQEDHEQLRLAGVQLLDPAIGGGLSVGVLAVVLGVHRSSLHRWRLAYDAEGLEGLRSGRRGPKGPHKLRGKARVRAQRDLERGLSQAEVARKAGVSEGTIRRALRQGRLRREHQALPSHVSIGQFQGPATVVQLEGQRKALVDQLKMGVYRAETELANLVSSLLDWHHDNEARSFLRQVFHLPADLIPDLEAGTLRVRLYAMANERSNRTLRGLCDLLNSYDTCYPGTPLSLVLGPPLAPE